MKRNVFGALIVAGGLVLATSIAGFAGLTPITAKAAVSACANAVVLTDATGLTGEAATEAVAIKAETSAAIAEVTAEANSNIDEAAAEATDEDGAKDAAALDAQLTAIVAEACKSFANLKSEYDAAIVELKAESTTPEVDKQNVEKQDVEKQDVEKKDVEKPEKPEVKKPEKPEVHSTTHEGND